MTKEEAKEELIEEWNEFIDGCGLRGIEEKEAKRNPDFKKVYEANLMAIQALEQEPCEDAISRQAVIKAVDKHTLDRSEIVLDEDITVILEEVPSVVISSAEQKTGHWIESEFDMSVYCSECNSEYEWMYDFCPSCGADMRGEQHG